MTLKERFLQWKRSVLPESASGTITNIFSNYSMWEAAKSEFGDAFIESSTRYLDFVRRDQEDALAGAVETIKHLRTLLEKSGVEVPDWKEPPF
jgi:hypothetical protein